MTARATLGLGLIALAIGGGCRGSARPSAARCGEASAQIATAMRVVRPDLEAADVDPGPDVAALCTEDGWSGKVVRCYRDAATPRQARACSDQLTDRQRERARTLQESLYKRASQVGELVGTADGAFGIAACDAYPAVVERLQGCSAMPPASRGQLQDAMKQQLDGWRTALADGGSEAREAIELTCQAAVDGLTQMLINMGC